MDVYLKAVPSTQGGELEVGGIEGHSPFQEGTGSSAPLKPAA
jgi:hypothetical protein